jgi:hypothetical protein
MAGRLLIFFTVKSQSDDDTLKTPMIGYEIQGLQWVVLVQPQALKI